MSYAAAPLWGQMRNPLRSASGRYFDSDNNTPETPSQEPSGGFDPSQTPDFGSPAQNPDNPKPGAKGPKNKRKMFTIIGIAAALLIALVVVIIVIVMQPKTYYLDDYFTVTVSGTDGYGTATVNWDREALKEVNEYLGKKGAKKMSSQLGQYGNMLGQYGDALEDMYASSFSLTSYVSVRLEPSTNLKNGGKVKVVMDIPEDFEKEFDVRFKLHDEEIEVSGLQKVAVFDPLEGLAASFSGYSGHGSYQFNLPSEAVKTPFGTASYSIDYRGNLLVSLQNRNSYYTLTYTVSAPDDLKNGDLITVTLASDSSPSAETLASEFGIVVSDASKAFTVAGLGELVTGDPAGFVSLTYEGYSGYATATLAAAQESVTLGDHTLKLSTGDGWGNRHYLNIEIFDGNGGDGYSFSYEAQFGDGLRNDDILTFSTEEYDLERIQARYGLVFPLEFTCTVSGLETGTAADPFTAVSMAFNGFDGFGTAEATVSDETIAAGDYTLKPAIDGNELTVIVADATGENIFTVTYRLNKSNNLANDDEIAFVYRSSFGVRDLREILELYTLEFPEEKTFTVSSLAAVTEVDVRDQLSFTFEGENGSIEMTVALKQDSITVGDYTIHLEVELKSGGWRGPYWVERFKIVDAEGTEIASGAYETDYSKNLSEGGTITVRENLNESQIASLTGLLFSTENKQIIVSTR